MTWSPAAPLGGKDQRPRELPVVVELAPHLLDPPHQQCSGVPEHWHQPLPGPRAPGTLTETHVDLAERAVLGVEVVEAERAELADPKPHLGVFRVSVPFWQEQLPLTRAILRETDASGRHVAGASLFGSSL